MKCANHQIITLVCSNHYLLKKYIMRDSLYKLRIKLIYFIGNNVMKATNDQNKLLCIHGFDWMFKFIPHVKLHWSTCRQIFAFIICLILLPFYAIWKKTLNFYRTEQYGFLKCVFCYVFIDRQVVNSLYNSYRLINSSS